MSARSDLFGRGRRDRRRKQHRRGQGLSVPTDASRSNNQQKQGARRQRGICAADLSVAAAVKSEKAACIAKHLRRHVESRNSAVMMKVKTEKNDH
jgi:hypothetical protein